MGLFGRRKQRKLEEQRRYELDEDGSRASRAGFDAQEKGNYAEAFQKLSEAAAKGHKDAIFGIAECYEYGRGTARDLEKAREYYEKSLNGVQTWDLLSRVALYRILSEESYSGYNYNKAYEYLEEVVRFEKREKKYWYNGHYHLAIHCARQHYSEETIKEALSFAFNKDTVCSMEPELVKRDIRRYNLPVSIAMADHMTSRGDTEAVHWLADHYASKGGYQALKTFDVNKGFVKSPYGQYCLAKAYHDTLATKRYLLDGEIERDGGSFWAHYTALRNWDLLWAYEIKEKYAKEYKRIMKEGWKAEREDMAVYDKVFDRDYYIRATVNSGCTNCGKCLRSDFFTEVNGKACIENGRHIKATIADGSGNAKVDYIYGGDGVYALNAYIKTNGIDDKYELLYYARECPAKCIQYEFYKD